MIEITNLTKSFNGFNALEDVSIKIEKGTIHGLIGENGAGKTTLIQCLTGIYKQDRGAILIDGEPVYENPAVKSKIGYVADSNQFFPYYTVSDMVNFFAGIYKNFSKEKFNTLNEILKVSKKRRISQLSKGMQMRLSLMLNISANPEVLVLDEPTSGLDAIAKNEVINIIIDEVEKRNITVLISSHHLSELEKLCDEMTILHHGKVTYQSSVDNIKEKVKKLQVVFKNTPDLSKIDNLLKTEVIGSVYYLITKDYTDNMKTLLYDLGADIVEEIGMSLEEIFIYTNMD